MATTLSRSTTSSYRLVISSALGGVVTAGVGGAGVGLGNGLDHEAGLFRRIGTVI